LEVRRGRSCDAAVPEESLIGIRHDDLDLDMILKGEVDERTGTRYGID
jgi:hypothetical protein